MLRRRLEPWQRCLCLFQTLGSEGFFLQKVKILVVKHGALGDVIQALDGFASLRAAYPDAHIAVMTGPTCAPFFSLMPWFDEVVVDYREKFFNFSAALKIRRYFKRDWCFIVDFQNSGRTQAYFLAFVRSRVRWIGRALFCSDPIPDYGPINHNVRMQNIAKIAGGLDTKADLDWLYDNCFEVKLKKLLRKNQRYVVLVPGCSDAKPEKRWSASKFADLAKCLGEIGFSVILVGTIQDQPVINEVKRQASEVIDLCAKTSLGELAMVFQRASAVVGNDTGPMFLAAKAGVPSLVLMGQHTDPARSAPIGAKAAFIKSNNINAIKVLDVVKQLKELSVLKL